MLHYTVCTKKERTEHMTLHEYFEFIENEILKAYRDADARGDEAAKEAIKDIQEAHFRRVLEIDPDYFYDSYE